MATKFDFEWDHIHQSESFRNWCKKFFLLKKCHKKAWNTRYFEDRYQVKGSMWDVQWLHHPCPAPQLPAMGVISSCPILDKVTLGTWSFFHLSYQHIVQPHQLGVWRVLREITQGFWSHWREYWWRGLLFVMKNKTGGSNLVIEIPKTKNSLLFYFAENWIKRMIF